MGGCVYALPPTSTLKSLRAEFKVLHPTPTASGEALKSVQSSMAPLPTALPALSMRTGRAQGKVCAHLCAVHEFVSYFSFSSLLLPPSFSNASLLVTPFPTPPAPPLSSGLSPVNVCFPVCVEVPSETEAVQGNPMKLRCISCMKREEVEATTVVEWFYRPEGGKDFLVCLTADSGLSFACFCYYVPGSFCSKPCQLLSK